MEPYDYAYENQYWEMLNDVSEALVVDKNNIPIMASAKVLDKLFSPLFGIHLKYVALLR